MNNEPQLNAAGQRAKRFGCFAIRIGAVIEWRLTGRIRLPSGRWLEKGSKIHLGVDDTTRHPDVPMTWHCRRPDVAQGKTPWSPCEHMADKPGGFASKKELLAAHRDNRLLRQDEEAHAYFAVAELPATPAIPAKKDKNGEEIEGAVEAQPVRLLLLSDEE
jgi:hypothetical protein